MRVIDLRLIDAIEQFEKIGLVTALIASNGNIALAGRVTGYERTTIFEKLKRWGIDPDDFRETTASPSDESVRQTQKQRVLNGSVLVYESVRLCVEALKECGWNRTRAAASLGISVRCLRYKILLARDLGFDVRPNPNPNAKGGRRKLKYDKALSIANSLGSADVGKARSSKERS